MTIVKEQEAAKAEREAEGRRRWTAAGLCAACAVAAAFVLLIMTKFPGHLSDSMLRALVALLLGATLVLGARALDGPIRLREHRRGQKTSSEAAAALMLWLGCFAALMTAFLVSDLVARVDVSIRGGGGAGGSFAPRDAEAGGPSLSVGNDRAGMSDRLGDAPSDEHLGSAKRSASSPERPVR